MAVSYTHLDVYKRQDINRGNRFLSLSAMATQSRGLHKFIVDNGGENHPLAKVRFNLGDIVTSMIKCANGQTVIVTHDTNSPRPYSLGFRIQGTEGLWMNDGDHVYVENQSKPHRWDDSEEWFKKFDHTLSVSYTHLDVYKRQGLRNSHFCPDRYFP